MVSFQCDACCDVVKKPKLDQHRLRCQSSFTCIDCSTTFAGPHEYKGHISCVTEAQKYEKALYKGPKQDGRQNNPAEQPAHNGWGAGSRTYNEYQQGPHQRNGQRDNQQRGRWQQRPIGSGGNELPLGRQSRMNFAHPEGAGTLGGLRSAQRSEPQPTATGNSAPVPPGIELYKEEEPKQQQYKDANQASKTEREAASKAVSSEKRQKKAEKTVHREPKDAKKVPKVPQAIIAPEVRESRNTPGSAVNTPFRPSTNEKQSKKQGASDLEITKEGHRTVDASVRVITVVEPVVERKKKSRKRKEGDGTIDPESSTAADTPGPKKKRKKERGKGKERDELAISEPTLVGAMPVRADENTKPKKRKRDEDGKEQDGSKAAKKARKAERKLEKVTGPAPSLSPDRSIVLSCNVSLSYDLGTNP